MTGLRRALTSDLRNPVFRAKTLVFGSCVGLVWVVASVQIMTVLLFERTATDPNPTKNNLLHTEFGAADATAKAQNLPTVQDSQETDGSYKPLIVMSTGGGLWNSGVWSGFDGQDVVRLAWANDGVIVDKRACKSKCRITQSQAQIDRADAVVMEVVNHKKFLGAKSRTTPFPFPKLRSSDPKAPLFVSFFFESGASHPETLDETFMSNFDITMGPSVTSTVPITMMCTWGKSAQKYLEVPDFDKKTNLAVFFNEHGIAGHRTTYIRDLVSQLGENIDAFQTLKNRNVFPPEAKQPTSRIDFMAKYKFALVVESVEEEDWVEAELSHALLAGVVPIYIGASNILDFVPSPTSFVNLRDWANRPVSALVSYLESVAEDRTAYMRFFEWKKNGLPLKFQQKLDQCVFHAECRLCEQVRRALGV